MVLSADHTIVPVGRVVVAGGERMLVFVVEKRYIMHLHLRTHSSRKNPKERGCVKHTPQFMG